MRENKGKSLLIFPTDYTVVDIETTGLSPEYDDIIEICALRYRNKELVDKFSTLINPNYEIDNFIVELTGITNKMLSTAPLIADVLPTLYSFLGSDILVGHNINFDINFLYDYCNYYLSKPLSNNYVDTMRIARLLHKENRHNRLSDLSKQYNLSYDGAHRAEYDCMLTGNLLNIFKKEFNEQYGGADLKVLGQHAKGVKAADITANVSDIPLDSPLYDKVVVFTGALEKMQRKEAMQVVADLGGVNGDNITKKTNYLVLGNNDYCTSIKDGKSSKQKKAELYKLKGYDIEIITENVFYDMIHESPITAEDIPNNSLYSSLSLTDKEITVIEIVKGIVSDSPFVDSFDVERRSNDYITLLCGDNDFMRFKYTPRAFWVSLRLPRVVADKNINNSLFAAQQNKKQLHWKCSIDSYEKIATLKDFILSSFVTTT